MTTTTIKLTKDEAERIATALNYYNVEYFQKKKAENPESTYWQEQWWKTVQLECRMFGAEKRIAKKEDQ